MIGVRAFGLCIGLRHIRSLLGLAVVRRPVAVIDIAVRIHPHQARTAARSLRSSRQPWKTETIWPARPRQLQGLQQALRPELGPESVAVGAGAAGSRRRRGSGVAGGAAAYHSFTP